MKIKSLLILSIIILFTQTVHAADAGSMLSECVLKIKGSKGIEATFKLTTGGKSINGTLKSANNKFAIITPGGSSWYNGKNMWSYNPSTSETTVVVPTSSELAEVNPLLYLDNYKSNYTPSFAKGKIQGNTVIVLTPKKKRSMVRRVEVAIGANKLPVSIKVTSSDGSNSIVTITKLNTGVTLSPSTFEYPKSQFPKAQIIDLR